MKILNKFIDSLATQDKSKYFAVLLVAVSGVVTPILSIILLFIFLLLRKGIIKRLAANIILSGFLLVISYLMYDGVEIPDESIIVTWLLNFVSWRSFVAIGTAFYWVNLSDYLLRTTGEVMLDEVITEENEAVPMGMPLYGAHANTLVIGTTRSGKTVYMLHEIEVAISEHMFTVIISGKNGALDEYSMRHVTQKLCEKYGVPFFLVSTSPEESDALPLNALADCDESTIADMLTTVSEFSEQHYLVNFRQYIMLICEVGRACRKKISLSFIDKYYDFKALQSLINTSTLSPESKKSFLDRARSCASIAADSRARVSEMLQGRGKYIFSDRNAITLSQVRKKGGVLMLDLDGLDAPDLSLQVATLACGSLAHLISSEPADTIRQPKLACFDELTVIYNEYLPRIYALGLGYGYACISGSQSFSCMDKLSPSLKKETVENSQQFIFLLQNEPSDSDYAAAIVGTKHGIERTKKLQGISYTEAGMQKIVREYKIHPDRFKELKTREGYFYQKLPEPKLIHFMLDFVECEINNDKVKPLQHRRSKKAPNRKTS